MIPKKDGLVVFKSKYGSTSEYARWIAEELKLPVMGQERLEDKALQACGYLVIGSPVYKGKLLIGKWLLKHRKALMQKRLFFFIVCATTAAENEKQKKIVRNNIPAEMLREENVFFLPGRLVVKNLSFLDGLFLKMGAKLEHDPVKKAAMLNGVDGVGKEHIARVVGKVEELVEQVL